MKRILILLTLFSSHAFADICTQADTDITASYKEMKKTSINSENYDYDKLFSLEQRFTEKLTTYLTQQGSFECTFPQATATGLVIKNAADNQLRAFLWESILYIKENDDTPHTFRYVLQYLGKNGKPQADASFIDVVAKPLDIYPIRLNNETIYGIAHEQLSKEEGTKHHSFFIRFLHINEENKLRPAMRLQNEGQYWLAYSYNPEQLAYYPTATNEKAKFHYDDKTQTLSFPLIIEDKNKQLTLSDQRIQYRFDGLYFFRLRHNVASQSCDSIDSILQRTYNEMIKNGSYGGNYNENKLIAATLRFESTLKSYLLQSSSLACRFPRMFELFYSVHIQSEDGKLNAFSWDNQTGGTMHNFGYVLQYVRDDGKPAILNMNKGEFGSKVISIFTASLNNKPYYWVIDYGIGGGRNHQSAATLYEMDGNTLKEAKLVKTNEAITSHISLAFDPSIMEDKAELKLIYDDKEKTISLPEVIDDQNYGSGRITEKQIIYHFNGQYFEEVKN